MSKQSMDFISDMQVAIVALAPWEDWAPELVPIIEDIRTLIGRATGL